MLFLSNSMQLFYIHNYVVRISKEYRYVKAIITSFISYKDKLKTYSSVFLVHIILIIPFGSQSCPYFNTTGIFKSLLYLTFSKKKHQNIYVFVILFAVNFQYEEYRLLLSYSIMFI